MKFNPSQLAHLQKLQDSNELLDDDNFMDIYDEFVGIEDSEIISCMTDFPFIKKGFFFPDTLT